MKRGPLIAFCALGVLLCFLPRFVSEAWWSRGGGDIVLVVTGVIVLGLIAWERRIKSS